MLRSIFPAKTDLYAGSLFISIYLGVNMYISIVLILAIAAIFTVTGGAHTVIYTGWYKNGPKLENRMDIW